MHMLRPFLSLPEEEKDPLSGRYLSRDGWTKVLSLMRPAHARKIAPRILVAVDDDLTIYVSGSQQWLCDGGWMSPRRHVLWLQTAHENSNIDYEGQTLKSFSRPPDQTRCLCVE